MTERPLPEAVGLLRASPQIVVTVRSSVDCPNVACAIRDELEVLRCDRDGASLARVAPLRQRSL